MSKNKITPCLWFQGNAEEAVNLYVSLFEDSEVTSVSRFPAGAPGPEGEVMSMNFTLRGEPYMALNDRVEFSFNESMSLFAGCETQEEVDRLWDALVEGGEESMCGWLKDRFGLSWQIVPTVLGRLLGDPDPQKAQRVMQAMLQMKKLEIKGLQDAYDSEN
jgi:predicted 3-demethylubiquinone-9 3-methyltransferase (glyoxalase superfamily)